uniref:FAS1 domain-containing protein n=1 Tax=Mycena chlorophos TaxID=658473 RepID=A0ABQ0LRL5_MYCCL|nr:predicted protein [Mycena chlorophos]
MHLRLCTLLGLLLPALAQSSPEQIVIGQTTMQPTIADLLTIESSASIFYSYARELTLSNAFSDTGSQLTVFAPSNKAVMALARKPHQDPEPIDEGVIITEEEFDARSKTNVERWVSAHLVPQSPITFDGQTYATLLDGKSLTLTAGKGSTGASDWSHAILGDGIHIVGMREASNGVHRPASKLRSQRALSIAQLTEDRTIYSNTMHTTTAFPVNAACGSSACSCTSTCGCKDGECKCK